MYDITAVSGVLLGITLLTVQAAHAGADFTESLLQGSYQEVLACDCDGDLRSDIVLVSNPTVSIFFQDPSGRFAAKPELTFSLGEKHAVLWADRLGRQAYSLLVADHAGVGEWVVRNRSIAPTPSTVVSCATVIPKGGVSVTSMRLSARTSGPMPLLLLPVGRDLQVWRHDGAWRRGQVLPDSLDVEVEAPIGQAGYTRTLRLDMSAGDVTGDGLDDLIVRKEYRGNLTYRLYVQESGGRFPSEPQVTYADREDWRTWHSWLDINHDGKADLVRSTWLHEPWFLPGMRSGKVLVRVFLAGAGGEIPGEPTYAVRKNDWTPPVPILDIDGDGFEDLALGYSPFNSRESFRKTLTAKQLDHDLRFHFFRPEEGFLPEPDCRHALTLHVDFRVMFLAMAHGGVQDRLFSLMGDFDGDGDRDLLLRDAGDHVSVYPFISRQNGFAPRPAHRFRHPGELDRLVVEDLNGDGVSDLLLELHESQGIKVFVSKGKR